MLKRIFRFKNASQVAIKGNKEISLYEKIQNMRWEIYNIPTVDE
jgi:hypothetical protein